LLGADEAVATKEEEEVVEEEGGGCIHPSIRLEECRHQADNTHLICRTPSRFANSYLTPNMIA